MGTKTKKKLQRLTRTMASSSSAYGYLSNIHSKDQLDFTQFIELFGITDSTDIEALIIHAISFKNMHILSALFKTSIVFTQHLSDVFYIDINSLYSMHCTSLIPIIKRDNNIPSNLFSESIISQSKNIEYDEQIDHPKYNINVSEAIMEHLFRTNGHFQHDMITRNKYQPFAIKSVSIKPCHFSYFDHCIFLGDYSMCDCILQIGGWHSFIHGNFMLFLRDKMMTQMKKILWRIKKRHFVKLFTNCMRWQRWERMCKIFIKIVCCLVLRIFTM